MANVGKRMRAIKEKIQPGKSYPIDDALSLIKDCASAKFLESVDVAVNLGVDPRKSDQVVRGATVLPNGTGKTVRVAVFAQGANAEAAKEAGADIVGFEDLAEQVKAGQMDFDVVIASPDAMRVVGQLGPILGPRGLMPNPKVGTVTPDVAGAVRNAKGGQVRYRTDKTGIIHCSIGKSNFEVQALRENLQSLLADLQKGQASHFQGYLCEAHHGVFNHGPRDSRRPGQLGCLRLDARKILSTAARRTSKTAGELLPRGAVLNGQPACADDGPDQVSPGEAHRKGSEMAGKPFRWCHSGRIVARARR